MEQVKLSENDVIMGPILDSCEVQECIQTAEVLYKNIADRKNLHSRSVLERFCNVAIGEIAEQSVISWLKKNNKYAILAVDKNSGMPDKGYDIILKNKEGRYIKCSVKSSISVYHSRIDKILTTFSPAITEKEVAQVNIQVYFWLRIKDCPRTNLPSEYNMAIIGWLGEKDFCNKKFIKYETEGRKSLNIKLEKMRSMASLLSLLE